MVLVCVVTSCGAWASGPPSADTKGHACVRERACQQRRTRDRYRLSASDALGVRPSVRPSVDASRQGHAAGGRWCLTDCVLFFLDRACCIASHRIASPSPRAPTRRFVCYAGRQPARPLALPLKKYSWLTDTQPFMNNSMNVRPLSLSEVFAGRLYSRAYRFDRTVV